jgi:NDP-sugar pyrophosphorylase family protein
MKAMIMAAGVGSRLEPLTCNVPKPMVPVVNRPAMEHIIKLLAAGGITQVAANLWYLPEKVRSYFGDGNRFGVELTYSLEKDLMGTAGGVKKLETFFNETFVIVSGDALTDVDLGQLLEAHRAKGALATIALKEVADPSDFGVVITENDGRIKAFQEKPRQEEALSRLANTGIYIFEPEIFKHIPENTVYDFGKQLFPRLVELGAAFYGKKIDAYWCDIGSLIQYRLAHYDILRGLVRVDVPGNWHPNALYVGDNSFIAPSARLGAKVVVGSNCHIGPGVEIFGETVIGDHCIIENYSSIFGSILWDHTRIGREARLVECVVAGGCHLKQGATIGSGTILGDDCIVEPGCIIEPNSKIWPGKVVEKQL